MKNVITLVCLSLIAVCQMPSFMYSAASPTLAPMSESDKVRLIEDIKAVFPNQTIFSPRNNWANRAMAIALINGYVGVVNSPALATHFLKLQDAHELLANVMNIINDAGIIDIALLRQKGVVASLEQAQRNVRVVTAQLKKMSVNSSTKNLRDVLSQLAVSLDAALTNVLQECSGQVSAGSPVEKVDEGSVMVDADKKVVAPAKLDIELDKLKDNIKDLFAKLRNRSVGFADPHTTQQRLLSMISDIQRIVDMAKKDGKEDGKFPGCWKGLHDVYNHLLVAVYALSDIYVSLPKRTEAYSQQDFSKMKAYLVEGQKRVGNIRGILGKDYSATLLAIDTRDILTQFAQSLKTTVDFILKNFDKDVRLALGYMRGNARDKFLKEHPDVKRYEKGMSLAKDESAEGYARNVHCPLCLKGTPVQDLQISAKPYVILPCKHAVHLDCIIDQSSSGCPLCKEKF